MRFGWADRLGSGIAVVAALALAACDRGGPASGDGAERAEASRFFLESNARAEGVTTLPSGLQYKVVQSGPPGGESPDRNDLVRVDYEGALTDGRVFDSSYQRGAPAVFTPETVVPGWTEALQKMKVGDEWILYVPPALGYGEEGAPPAIPGSSVLVFKIKLLDLARVPGGGSGVGRANG